MEPMDTSPGQRTLAAIVFTDTVGFSQLVGKDEEGTLKLVKKDLDLMTHLCDRFGGRVVKSTGDGLMMIFSSAVQAVNCSLDIQRIFTEQARHDGNALKHRIGVHLGDVIISGDDALGDGVNVAARLEQESEPGGICMSQVVYDVVKGRMFLEAAKIGELRLKNIAEPVGAYKVAGVAKAKRHKKARQVNPAWVIVVVGVLALVTVGGVLLARYARGDSDVLAPTSQAQGASRSVVDPPPTPAPPKEQNSVTTADGGQNQPSADQQSQGSSLPTSDTQPASGDNGAGSVDDEVGDTSTPATPIGQSVAQSSHPTPTPFQAAWKQYARKYDYANMAAWVRDNPGDVPAGAAQSLQARYESLANVIDWTKAALAKTSAQAPLQIGFKGNPGTVWQQPDGRLAIRLPNNRYVRKLSVLGPIIVASIIRGLVAVSQVDANTRDSLLNGAQDLVADANEHKQG